MSSYRLPGQEDDAERCRDRVVGTRLGECRGGTRDQLLRVDSVQLQVGAELVAPQPVGPPDAVDGAS